MVQPYSGCDESTILIYFLELYPMMHAVISHSWIGWWAWGMTSNNNGDGWNDVDGNGGDYGGRDNNSGGDSGSDGENDRNNSNDGCRVNDI